MRLTAVVGHGRQILIWWEKTEIFIVVHDCWYKNQMKSQPIRFQLLKFVLRALSIVLRVIIVFLDKVIKLLCYGCYMI